MKPCLQLTLLPRWEQPRRAGLPNIVFWAVFFAAAAVFTARADIVITPNTNATELAQAITSFGGGGLTVRSSTLIGYSQGSGTNIAVSSGFFNLTGPIPDTYGLIIPGVVLSCGDVRNYGTGTNMISGKSTGYGVAATEAQEALLRPLTPGHSNHYDAVELDLVFDMQPGYSNVFFQVVFGSEEWPEYVGSYVDAFGLYLNGTNIAYATNFPGTSVSPINIDHTNMMAIVGTELDGILAPGSNAVLNFVGQVTAGSTNNTLIFIISDTSDSILDSTIYISALGGKPPPPPADVSISMTDSPDPVGVGLSLTYSLMISNNGPGIATNIVVTNTLPSSVTFVTASSGSTNGNNQVISSITSLASNAASAISIGVLPNANGVITNIATVASASADPVSANNTATQTTTVRSNFRFSSASYTVAESNNAVITVLRPGGGGMMSVDYATSSLTAVAGSDYWPTNGTLSFGSGETSKTFQVTIINDSTNEYNERVALALSNPIGGATLIAPSNAVLTILDDEPPLVTIKATDNRASEPGSDMGVIMITRVGNTANALTVFYTVPQGAGYATTNADFMLLSGSVTNVTASGSVTIPAGLPSKMISLKAVDDLLVEGTETNLVTLFPTNTYTIGASSNTIVFIDDNDTKPTVNVAATDATAAEAGNDPGTFTVTRSGVTTTNVTVFYALSGTATTNADYWTLSGGVTNYTASGSVMLTNGQITATITLTPVDDAAVEGNETAVLTLAADASYNLGSSSNATVIIADNDAVTVTVTATDPNAAEAGSDPGTFTITRSGLTSTNVTVIYSMSGTAANGTDYASLAGTLTLTNGQTLATVTVTPVDDAAAEGSETAILTLVADAAYNIGASTNATVTIADNELATVKLTAIDSSAGEAGGNTGAVRITRSGVTTGALTVLYSLSGTATTNADYATVAGGVTNLTDAGSVTLTNGQTWAAVTLAPVDDAAIESSETAIFALTANAAYNVGWPSTATVTILDNDTTVVSVTATDNSAAETGSDPGTFVVTRAGITNGSLTVLYSMNGTATTNADYWMLSGGVTNVTASGSVTLTNTQTSATITLTPVDDAVGENLETAVLALATNAAYSIISSASNATVTIADNDNTAVSVTATDNSAAEAGSDPGTFVITRSLATNALTVYYAFSGTATTNADYWTLSGSVTNYTASGSVTLTNSQTTATITLTPVDDTQVEDSETAILTLLTNASYDIGSSSNATVTIADDDISTISLTATDASASETVGNTGTINITRTGATNTTLTVYYSISGTASNSADYLTITSGVTNDAATGSVTLTNTQTSAAITLTAVDDTQPEGSETAIFALTANAAYALGSPTNATVTIADNDAVTVRLTATDVNASEAGAGTGTVKITRTGATNTSVTVYYSVSGTAGVNDYAVLAGNVTMTNTETSAIITLTPVDDALAEANETAIFTLTANAAYTIGWPSNATITIADDDATTVKVTATDSSATETAGNTGTFTVTRTGNSNDTLTVLYAMSGTATNGTDYTALTGSLTMTNAQTSAAVALTPIDDADAEGSETAIFTLIANAAYTIGAPSNATVTVIDNDFPTVTVTATDAFAAETTTNQTSNTGVFTITRAGVTNGSLTVLYSLSGTATTNADYVTVAGGATNLTASGSVTLTNTQTSATVTVMPVDDAVTNEANETVILKLTTNSAYSVGSPSNATVMILDNDSRMINVVIREPPSEGGEPPSEGGEPDDGMVQRFPPIQRVAGKVHGSTVGLSAPACVLADRCDHMSAQLQAGAQAGGFQVQSGQPPSEGGQP